MIYVIDFCAFDSTRYCFFFRILLYITSTPAKLIIYTRERIRAKVEWTLEKLNRTELQNASTFKLVT